MLPSSSKHPLSTLVEICASFEVTCASLRLPMQASSDLQLCFCKLTKEGGEVLPCRHFDYTRPGGRAGKRAGDFVRRRRWRRNEQAGATAKGGGTQPEGAAAKVAAAAEIVATSLVSPVTQMQGARCGYRHYPPCA